MSEPVRISLIAHAPSANTAALRDAALAGAAFEGLERTRMAWHAPLAADAAAIDGATAVLLGTSANFGYMSGALKDWFDRSFPLLDGRCDGLPYTYYVRGGSDATGCCRAIEAIASGMNWRRVLPPVCCVGEWQPGFPAQVEELAATLAAGLESCLY